MYNPESFLENETYKKKKTYRIVDFAVPADHRVKSNESKKRYKYQDLVRELKNMEHDGDADANCY